MFMQAYPFVHRLEEDTVDTADMRPFVVRTYQMRDIQFQVSLRAHES